MEDEVFAIGKKLEKLVEQGQADDVMAMDNLKRLKEIPVTLDILQKTRIGMSVNVLRKASNKDEIQSLAKLLIKTWKKLLDSQEKPKASKSDSPSIQRCSSDSNMSNSSQSSVTLAAAAISQVNGNGSKNLPKSTPKPLVSFPPLKGDVTIRQKCREMLESSLKGEEDHGVDITELATDIEDAIFQEFKDSGTKYKNRVKSRVMNLRDKKNPLLKERVIKGGISPTRFATMKPEEMASEEMKKERQEFTQQAIKDHQLATTGGTGTDQFKCSRCGKRNCTYNQVQTRSADEPMTTFVYCNECGKRWKNSIYLLDKIPSSQ
eukprot:gene4777-5404_t